MTIKEVSNKFLEKPERMRMSNNKLAVRYKCTANDIVMARLMTRSTLSNKKLFEETGFVKVNTADIPTWADKSVLNKTVKAKSELDKKIVAALARVVPETYVNYDYKHVNDNTAGIHIVSGCWHVPFQNKRMQKGLIELIKDLGDKVKGFHLIGDMLDVNSLSAHEPNKVPMKDITLGFEYAEGNKFLNSFEEVLPVDTEKVFIWGNHENRWTRHVADINISKYADALPSPTEALQLKQRGYKIYENWKEDFHMLGKQLQLIHGEFCTKYPARTHVDRMKASVMFAHTHRIDINYDGEKAGFNIGWGGDVNSQAFSYVSRLTKMNWINGFALVHIDEAGNYFTQVIPVFHNEFWYNGVRYGH